VQIGVVPRVETHDLDRTAERRRFPDDFLVRILRRRPQSTVDTVIHVGEGFQIDPQVTLQGQEYRAQVGLRLKDHRKYVLRLVPCRQPVSDVTRTPLVGLRRRCGVIDDQDALARLYAHAHGRSVNRKGLLFSFRAKASVSFGLAGRLIPSNGGTGTNHA
jgi:hypothetical protein